MARSSRTSSEQWRAIKKKPRAKSNPRAVPGVAEIDATVSELISRGHWQELAEAMRAHARRLNLPANIVLMDSIARQLAQYVFDHPEHADALEADLDAAEEEIIGCVDVEDLWSLDDAIAVLQAGARKLFPTVH